MSLTLRETGIFLLGMLLGLVVAAVVYFAYTNRAEADGPTSYSGEISSGTSRTNGRQHVEKLSTSDSNTRLIPSGYAHRDAQPMEEFMAQLSDVVDFDRVSDEQMKLLQNTAHAWIVKEGVDAVEVISDSLHEDLQLVLFDRVLEKVVRSDPVLALDAALSMGLAVGRTLAWEVIQDWATSDPKAALDRLAALDLNEDLQEDLQYSATRFCCYESPQDFRRSRNVGGARRQEAMRKLWFAESPVVAIANLRLASQACALRSEALLPFLVAGLFIRSLLPLIYSFNRV